MSTDRLPLRVIILCDFAVPTGGSQKVAIESARALAEAGVDVVFVHGVPNRDDRLDHPLIDSVDLGLKDVWDRPMVQAAIAGVWDRAVRRVLTESVLAQQSDGRTLIHLHQWTRALSPSAFAACFDSGLPLVVTAHDYFLSCPNGVYYRFDQERPCALRPLSFDCITSRCDPRSAAHKAIRVARSVATSSAIRGRSFDIIHVSDRGRDILQPLLPPTVRHHRIDNPIDTRRRPSATIRSGAKFAFIGRLTREKGVVVAAEAARRANIPISFIGEGPAEADIRMANPAAELLGWRKGSELESLLSGGVKAVVAPSLWFETGPLTVGEAAAAGVAAIASRRCGAAERIVHGSTGFVVEPDADSLAGAMNALSDRAMAQTFGQAAYDAYWAKPPNSRAHASALIALYSEIVARRSSGEPALDMARRK